MTAVAEVVAVAQQHVIPALRRRDAVDHHAEPSCKNQWVITAGRRGGAHALQIYGLGTKTKESRQNSERFALRSLR